MILRTVFTLMVVVFITSACKPAAKPNPVVSNKVAVESALQKSGGAQRIEKEANVLFGQFGTDGSTSIYGDNLRNSPALMRLALSLDGEVIGIEPKQGGTNGLPAHFRIRFGNHQRYHNVNIFPAGTSVPTNTGLIHITNNIFLEP